MGCTQTIPVENEGFNKMHDMQHTKNNMDPSVKTILSESNSNNDNENKLQKDPYETLLASPGELEIPEKFKKWFPENHGHKNISKLFKYHGEIGHGVTGSVYEIEYKQEICAIKQVEKNDVWARMLFTTEARVLSKIRHKGIIGFIDMFFDERYYYLILDKADFDLYYVMKKKGHLSERKTRSIIYNLLLSLDYLHKKDLAHRDLKPENIVFKANNTNQPILIDFGDAERARDDKIYTEFVGTPPYMSPERLDQHKGWQLKKADIWAVAVIAYEMYCGQRCFQGDTQKQVFRKILRGEWQWPSHRKPSQNMQDFISQCLNQDAALRPNAEEAINHIWFDKKRKEHSPIIQHNKLVDNVSAAVSIDEEETKTNYQKIKPGNINTTDPIIKIKDITQRQQKTDGCIKLFENLASMVKSNALQNILVKGYAEKMDNDDLAPYKQQFDKLDTDKDGFITGTDLISSFTANGIGPNQASSLASIIINELESDRSKSKKISFRQFLEARLKYNLSNQPKDFFDDILSESTIALNDSNSNLKQYKDSEMSKQIVSGFESEHSRSSKYSSHGNIITIMPSSPDPDTYSDEEKRAENLNTDHVKVDISADDIIAFSKSQSNLTTMDEMQLRQIFDRFDKDGDGRLNFQDFVQAVYCSPITNAPIVDKKQHLLPKTYGLLTKSRTTERALSIPPNQDMPNTQDIIHENESDESDDDGPVKLIYQATL